MKGEIWKPVRNYEGLYEVSNLGRVKSLNYNKTGKERIMKSYDNGKGYLKVQLFKEGKDKGYYMHVLVATAFCENPEGYTEVNHINEIKSDNRAENLEWVSHEYNLNYGTRNKRAGKKLKGRKQSEEHIKKRIKKMTNNPKLSKPVIGINKISGLIIEFPSTQEASRQTGINHGNICACLKGKRNSAGGHIWFYADDDDNE